ncbi:hypothetical protein [Microcystis phage Mwe-Yong1]|nr:hypothetical protein [Microcystis phage Mwe-Yong1]
MAKIERSQPRIASMVHAAVILGTDATILADTAMANGATTQVTVFAAQPDVPRNLTVKGNDANVTGNVVIEGVNAGGEVISETLALNAANVVVGNKAFARVTRVTLPAYAVANTERVRVGVGSKLGLSHKLNRNTVLAAFRAGAREGTAPTVAVSASALENNTVTLNSALNGSAVVVDYYETL